jgi:hypothetical protein
MQCALALGAKSVTAIDINDDKLALAKTLGASCVFNSKAMSAEEISAHLNDNRLSNWCWKRLARRRPFRWPLISRVRGQKSRWWVRCTMT